MCMRIIRCYIACLGIVGAVIVAAVIAFTTERGRNLASFMQDARTEVRKMVWPTRGETVQTTTSGICSSDFTFGTVFMDR